MLRRSDRRIRVGAWAIAAASWLAAPPEAAASGLNVERVRMNPDEDGLHGGFTVGVDFQAGNANRLDLSTAGAIAFRKRRHLTFLIGDAKYSTRTRANQGEGLSTLLEPSSRFVNRATVHLRYNYELRRYFAPEVFAQVDRDEFLLVEGRVLFGLGPRFVPYNDGEFSLALGTDWMLEYEALDPSKVVRPLPPDTLVHRWSSYLALIYSTPRLSMSSITYLQPRFDLPADLRLMTEAALDVTLIEPVSLRLTARLRWDSRPSVFCTTAVGIDGCAPADQIRLREVDVALENSIAVRF